MEATARLSHIRVALYGRVSTLDKGQDVNLQLNELREYSQRRGWKITGEYVDKQGAVLLRHLQRRMAEHFLQVKRATALPQIVDCERMTEAVKRSLWHFDAQLSTQPLRISQHITATEGDSMTGAEDERMIVTESPQELPQFWTERHSPVPRSLAVQGQQH